MAKAVCDVCFRRVRINEDVLFVKRDPWQYNPFVYGTHKAIWLFGKTCAGSHKKVTHDRY